MQIQKKVECMDGIVYALVIDKRYDKRREGGYCS